MMRWCSCSVVATRSWRVTDNFACASQCACSRCFFGGQFGLGGVLGAAALLLDLELGLTLGLLRFGLGLLDVARGLTARLLGLGLRSLERGDALAADRLRAAHRLVDLGQQRLALRLERGTLAVEIRPLLLALALELGAPLVEIHAVLIAFGEIRRGRPSGLFASVSRVAASCAKVLRASSERRSRSVSAASRWGRRAL